VTAYRTDASKEGETILRLLTSSPTTASMGKEGYSYLPRLERVFYQGDAVVHWTNTVFDHSQGWLNEAFHARFRELMLHEAPAGALK
jgi:hypothetical protein